MWSERMRQEWQHTSTIAAYLIEVNRTSKGKRVSPDELNPMEAGQKRSGGGIKLNSPEGFAALRSVASQWRPKQ